MSYMLIILFLTVGNCTPPTLQLTYPSKDACIAAKTALNNEQGFINTGVKFAGCIPAP